MFWLCTDMLESTVQTGPFPSKRAAKRHAKACKHGKKGTDWWIKRQARAPFFGTIHPPTACFFR